MGALAGAEAGKGGAEGRIQALCLMVQCGEEIQEKSAPTAGPTAAWALSVETGRCEAFPAPCRAVPGEDCVALIRPGPHGWR